jgi:hypothetical protein
MTPTEYSDVKRLYKFAIAYDSFSEISRSCEHLITAGTESTAPEYYIMAAGIVTIYGRPFIAIIEPAMNADVARTRSVDRFNCCL